MGSKRLLAFWGAMSLAACALAADGARAVRGSYFALIVGDVDVSSAWYRETLGLEAKTRRREEGRYDIVNLDGDGLFVELLGLAEARERPDGLLIGPFKVGMFVADLEAFVEVLPRGVEKPRVVRDDDNGVLLIQLRDPDGNVVQVMQRLDD